MNKLNYIYTRLLIAFITMMVTSVVWGQGLPKIPITGINSWPNPTVDDKATNVNLYDGTAANWRAERGDNFRILPYMQIEDKNNDYNKNEGKRSWIEIPYIPNANTKIEVVVAPNGNSVEGWKTQYVFGSGDGNGMSFGLANTSPRTQSVTGTKNMYLFKIGGHRYEYVVDNISTDQQTIICTATSANIGSNTAAAENTGSFTADNKKLCFFYNPYTGWDGARCFYGKIYSAKISENGKVIYDLVPCVYQGRSGFYDRISTNFFGFLDFVDYIENDVTSWEQNHIHIKVPYTVGSDKKQRTGWTSNVVTNGDFSGSDLSSFEFVNDDWEPRAVTDGYGTGIQVFNNGSHIDKTDSEGNTIVAGIWDTHLTVKLDETLQVGKEYIISFLCKAKNTADVRIDFQNEELGFHHYYDAPYDGGVSYGYGDEFKTDNSLISFSNSNVWTRVRIKFTPRENTNGLIKGIGLNFNNAKIYNKYYIAEIHVKPSDDDTKELVSNKGDDPSASCFIINDDWKDRIQTVDSKKTIQLKNDGTTDSQLRIKLGSNTLAAGDKYFVSFSYRKETGSTSVGTELQTSGGSKACDLQGSLTFNDTWQKVTWSGTVPDGSQTAANLALLFPASAGPGTYFVTDIVVKKGTLTGEWMPVTEVEIDYQGYTGESQSLRRHLFTFGTYEQGNMGLSTQYYNYYKYRSGQLSEEYKVSMDGNRNTVKGRLMEWDLNGTTYFVSGTPTWAQDANALYFFGTHYTNSDNADSAASYWGKIYSAIVREGDNITVNLQPARDANGNYGLYDKVGRVFYGKDSESNSSAVFTGATVTNHSSSLTEEEQITPYSLTISTNNQVARNFVITTTNDDDTNTNPRRWRLYGTTGDGGDNCQWVPINATLVPRFSPMAADGETVQYLYNVESGQFLTDGGRWGTGATLGSGEKVRKIIAEQNGTTYKLKNCAISKDMATDGKYLFSDYANEVFTDYNNTGKNEWSLSSVGSNIYNLSIDGIGNLGCGDDYSTSNTLTVSSSTNNTTWAFVTQADYDDYIEALTAGTTDQTKSLTKDGFEYVFRMHPVNSDGDAIGYQVFTKYRFVIESAISGNIIDLQELAFTTDYVFEHKVGRVYDGTMSGAVPDNLKVNGSSGYKSEWKTSADDPRLITGVQIQRTHEYEHEIYVLPGETVDLSPFADFSSTTNYQEHYIRWYDYKTDRYTPRLAFDDVSGRNAIELDKGFFAWNKSENSRTREGSIALYTASNNPTSDSNGVIDVIAIEAGNTYNGYSTMVGDNTCYTIEEPTLLWRHRFVIKDAKARSNEMFADAAANKTYMENHRIKLMCPAGVPFQYPLPCFEYVGSGSERPTNFYYLKDNVYTPVYHYTIDTYEVTGEGTSETLSHLGSRNSSYIGSGESVKERLAYPYKQIDGYNRVFYIQNPQEGHYRIKINALGPNYQAGIRDQRMGDVPVQLAEYDLIVLPPTDGIMITEEQLNSNANYAHQRPKEMDRLYGKTTTKVDFDDVKSSDLTARTSDNVSGYYYKWPWQWENSSYGFGFENRGDYNMYMVADVSGITPYHGNEGDKFKNIHDRLYNDTNGSKKGYFFYANAASDPSRMSVLNIGKNFCPNTKVYVSAWINELQGRHPTTSWYTGNVVDGYMDPYAETANVIFSLRGVKTDGTETVLNSFVSGYVSGGWNTPHGYDETKSAFMTDSENPDNRGKWMHVYYTFSTEGITANEYDHYIITLENNCTSSVGADYAIDDIRVYVCKADIMARQSQPLCNGSTSTALELYGNFDDLKTKYQFVEGTNQNITFNYCFLDYDIYEKSLQTSWNALSESEKTTYPDLATWRENGKQTEKFVAAYKTAFNAAYNSLNSSYGSGQTYGTINLNTTFANNNNLTVGSERYVIFNCNATDADMSIGKKYYVALVKYDSGIPVPSNTVDYQTYFKIEDTCESVSSFEVTTSYGQIKVDGQLFSEQEGLSFCANQKPVVNISLNGIKKGGEVVQPNSVYFDWYFGPLNTVTGYEDYNSAKNSNNVFLSTAMTNFRDEYPTATQSDVMEGTSVVADGAFTQAMLDYIKEMVTAGKLALYKTAEVISTADQYKKETRDNKFYITAIPINPTPEDRTIQYCLEPLQVYVNLNTKAPSMYDGDNHGVVWYGDVNDGGMKDVPLRIGLKQLNRVRIDKITDTGNKLLWLPLRNITTSAEGINALVIPTAKKAIGENPAVYDDLIYLFDSNDPAVANGTSGAKDVTEWNTYGEVISSGMKVVGRTYNIEAKKKDNGNDFKDSHCKMAFLKSFKFREGYYYRLKLHYADEGTPENACPGELVFTVNVVPEYQMWTGAKSRNWNDDRNWKRVSSSDLLWTSSHITDDTKDFVTDGGTNDNTASFIPADFTKVIIPAEVQRVPYMYNMRRDDNTAAATFVGSPSNTVCVRFASAPTNSDVIGGPTDKVGVHMSSIDISADGDVACRPWYDHTCDQIHFNSGAEIMDQRYLYYNKAWCDIEVPVGTWQTVASPLMNIVAGDLYLPTDGARQNTPLFEDITYLPTLNDRFKPAVYQRSWNKSNATVYKLDQSSTDVGVKLDWSHVYNDVNVKYGAGQGFSIKVDVSALEASKRPTKAKFRFPKADVQYTYYNPGNTDADKKTENVNSTDIVNDVRPGKLANLTSTFTETVGDGDQNSATATSYFLVGNPLMCYLDMEKFFTVNDQFEKKYWIATADGQRTALSTDVGFISTSSEDPKFLPPGVSFFVKLNPQGTTTSATTQSPKFTAAMMSYTQGEVSPNEQNPSNGQPSNGNGAKTRAAEGASTIPQLRLTAEGKDGRKSIALLTDGTVAKHDMVETLFDSNLRDELLLYTTKNGQAQTIASIAPGDTLPLVTAGMKDDVVLHIEGAENFNDDLYVIDSEKGTIEPLTDDMTLDCTSSGVRYYIVSPCQNDEQEEMSIDMPRVTAGNGKITIYAPKSAEIANAQIFTTGGMCVDRAEHITTSHTASLSQGIYIVKLNVEGKEYCYKLCLK